jgi:hypothetical protein
MRRGRAPAFGSVYSWMVMVLGSTVANLFVPNSQKNGALLCSTRAAHRARVPDRADGTLGWGPRTP